MFNPQFGVWRSPVARLLWEQEVPGSNPGAPTVRRCNLGVVRNPETAATRRPDACSAAPSRGRSRASRTRPPPGQPGFTNAAGRLYIAVWAPMTSPRSPQLRVPLRRLRPIADACRGSAQRSAPGTGCPTRPCGASTTLPSSSRRFTTCQPTATTLPGFLETSGGTIAVALAAAEGGPGTMRPARDHWPSSAAQFIPIPSCLRNLVRNGFGSRDILTSIEDRLGCWPPVWRYGWRPAEDRNHP